eukprot:695633_1
MSFLQQNTLSRIRNAIIRREKEKFRPQFLEQTTHVEGGKELYGFYPFGNRGRQQLFGRPAQKQDDAQICTKNANRLYDYAAIRRYVSEWLQKDGQQRNGMNDSKSSKITCTRSNITNHKGTWIECKETVSGKTFFWNPRTMNMCLIVILMMRVF